MPDAIATTAPTLHTERLILRAHTPADFAECAAMWGDAEVTRYIGGRPSTAEETWTRVLRYAGMWALLGHGYWAVRERQTGRWVGDVGLADFHRDVTPPLDGPEAGWVLDAWAHGRGYATEAVRAVVSWADAHLAAPRTVCMISPGNAASVHVAEKCGYRPRASAAYKGEPTLVFERPRVA